MKWEKKKGRSSLYVSKGRGRKKKKDMIPVRENHLKKPGKERGELDMHLIRRKNTKKGLPSFLSPTRAEPPRKRKLLAEKRGEKKGRLRKGIPKRKGEKKS